ncbi:ABC transporter permease [Fulvivirga sediminis]|uniref:DUF3526 domain-containing protein n=1 Tax=Fulvivirga sediminis TaxID=2803949 RepID=A0A937K1P6_9BACT|nr:DUF3526 domain-containing protein [Fulvivirga sediminis]MBL3658809.1 DUF3526 domain-containing protein [Fulvivirga sediminis]
MKKRTLLIIAKQFCASVFKSKAIYLLVLTLVVLLVIAARSGVAYYDQNHYRIDHQQMARESWEGNPDKHPHRMAHFGTFAFRLKHPLSIFDFGVESFTGNAVFLEAHKQNVVNFSEASFSTGLLRFGELSMAMVLQTILPLIIFFIGYSAIVADRENGTLKILLTQGAKWKEILFGKALGLSAISLLFCLPFLGTITFILLTEEHVVQDDWMRFAIIVIAYSLVCFILSFITIYVSLKSDSSKNALVKLLGLWLLMVILVPRTSQAIGAYFYETPSKVEFRAAIEQDVLKYGDSHDINDPFFKALKDSVLQANHVKTVEELPFNYGGFLMSKGERISANIYGEHHKQLLDQYRKQNQLTQWLAIINPFLALKNLSMSVSGTDFESYVHFQEQAEDYRYKLAQKMNSLQMKYITPNPNDKTKGSQVSRDQWKSFSDFQYTQLTTEAAILNVKVSIISILSWFIFSIALLVYGAKKATAI